MTGPCGRPTGWRHLRTVVIVAAAGMVASSCAGSATSVTPPAEAHIRPYTYVAIGGSESVGYDANDPARQAFPVLLDQKLPHQTSFYDLAVPDANAEDVLAHQEATAVALHPDLVTIWVGISDMEEGVSPTCVRSRTPRNRGAVPRAPRTGVARQSRTHHGGTDVRLLRRHVASLAGPEPSVFRRWPIRHWNAASGGRHQVDPRRLRHTSG